MEERWSEELLPQSKNHERTPVLKQAGGRHHVDSKKTEQRDQTTLVVAQGKVPHDTVIKPIAELHEKTMIVFNPARKYPDGIPHAILESSSSSSQIRRRCSLRSSCCQSPDSHSTVTASHSFRCANKTLGRLEVEEVRTLPRGNSAAWCTCTFSRVSDAVRLGDSES